MKMHVLRQTQDLPISMEEAWAFFSTPRNLDDITPDELGFRIESLHSDTMHEGQIITYKVKVAPGIWIPWVTEIKAVEEGVAFVDEQRFGPYRFWHHRHHFEPVEGGVRMHDLVHYALPMGPFGEVAHAFFVKKKLGRIFGFRREVLEKRFGKM
jgi:ligand-binding SRPBCC domain-containing protein